MSKLENREDLASILNKSLGNNFIDELIVNHCIDESLFFFDDDIVLVDNAFSEGICIELTGKKKVKSYFETLFAKNSELFIIESRDLEVSKLDDKFYNISILLKGLSVETNSNSFLKINLLTTYNTNNCFVINDLTLNIEKNLNTNNNRMNGGLLSFKLNRSFSIDFISDELMSFLKYEHKSHVLSSLNGRLSSSICFEERQLLKKIIDKSIQNQTYFKTSLSLKNALGNYIDVDILGETLMMEEDNYEVFAIICEKAFDLKFEIFSDSISSHLISLAQSYHNPIFWKDSSDNFLGCNVAYLEQFHIKSVKDLLYKNDRIIFGKKVSDKHSAENKKLIDGSINQFTTSENLVIENDTIYIKVTKVPLFRNGCVVGIIGIVLDVTMEEKLKKTIIQKENEINYVFALSNHGYFIKDVNFKYINANQIFCDILNISMDKIIGKTNDELLIDQSSSKNSEIEILKTKKQVGFTYTKKVNGTTKYYRVTENPLLNEQGEILKIIGNVIDNTEIVNKRKKLSKDYNRVISVLNEKHNVSFLTIDMNTQKITSYLQKGNKSNLVGLVYCEDLMKYNINKFLYEKEKVDFINTFCFESLVEIYKTQEELKKIYTIMKYNSTLIKVLFTVDYNINPFNSHVEASIKSTDITEFQFTREIVNSFDKREYDFIVRLSTSIDTFVVVYSDKSQYDFSEYKNDCNVDKFLDILFKNSISKRPKSEEWMKGLKECFEPHAEWNFDIDTIDGRRKNIIVRPLDEEKQSVIIVSQDITKRTKHDKNIQIKLERLANEAVAANTVKTDFLARMSHDMRTPLSAIMGLSDFGIIESKNEDLKSYFEKIKNSGEYLKTLLNDVLDMQVIEKGDLVLNPTNAKMIERIENVKTIIHPRAFEKNISLSINKINMGPHYISVDIQRAEQVLVNILTNAVKYTKPNGHIDWSIQFFNEPTTFVRHTISDNGVGMSKEFQKNMYDSFTREDNIFSSAEGGSGLGLAIVKNIVKVMGGHIKCESELGKGTIFELEIPVKPISKEKYECCLSQKKCFNSEFLMNRKILVCEDNQINITIIKKLLSQYNITIDIAHNGKIGVKKAYENNYDAILMDIRMPVMNGLVAAKAIRDKDKKIPIIAVSANAYKKDIEQSISYGMNAHLSKPINKDDLFYTLATLIK